MGHVSFIRHAPLEAPFNNYDHASLAQLDDLATNRVTPSIDMDRAQVSTATSHELALAETALILCASSVRAGQTAKAIAKTTGYEGPIVTLSALDEVAFTPTDLVPQDDYEKHGMQVIRDRLFEASVGREPGSENIDSIYKRIAQLDGVLADASAEQTLCVTHGFLMRFLQLYFGDPQIKEPSLVTTEIVSQQINFPNLHGFRAAMQ
jgi:broad specificity phosphatase PhoE